MKMFLVIFYMLHLALVRPGLAKSSHSLASTEFYVAAVAEHSVFMGVQEDSSDYKLEKNIGIYENLIELSKSLSVQVLVFPEFGLTPASPDQRSSLYPYMEVIPDTAIIPCGNSSFTDRPILQRMSCAARENQQLILINMIDNVACDITSDASCPDDSHYQYNTDVIFDETGTLVAKYHKSHEFPPFLVAYDQPASPSRVTYKSSFGVEFGLFICYDIMFPDPAKILRESGIEHFLYAVAQHEVGEKLLIEPWSRNNNAVVLSSNLGSGRKDCSGLIVNGTPLPAQKHYLDSAEFPEENLLVANVPVEIATTTY